MASTPVTAAPEKINPEKGRKVATKGKSKQFHVKYDNPELKVVVRLLPPTLAEDQFMEQLKQRSLLLANNCSYTHFYYEPGSRKVKTFEEPIFSRAYFQFPSKHLATVFKSELHEMSFEEPGTGDQFMCQTMKSVFGAVADPQDVVESADISNDPLYSLFLTARTEKGKSVNLEEIHRDLKAKEKKQLKQKAKEEKKKKIIDEKKGKSAPPPKSSKSDKKNANEEGDDNNASTTSASKKKKRWKKDKKLKDGQNGVENPSSATLTKNSEPSRIPGPSSEPASSNISSFNSSDSSKKKKKAKSQKKPENSTANGSESERQKKPSSLKNPRTGSGESNGKANGASKSEMKGGRKPEDGQVKQKPKKSRPEKKSQLTQQQGTVAISKTSEQ